MSLLTGVKKTQILSKNMSLDQFKERATNFIKRDPSLEPCLPLLDSEDDHEVFTVTGFKGLGVPIGTPDFITRFVAQKVKEYANDVDKLDILQDGKVHFDLLKFCHMPRFNYLNGLVLTPSLWSAQQHQFDYKVHDALIRKGTHNQFLSSEMQKYLSHRESVCVLLNGKKQKARPKRVNLKDTANKKKRQERE